MNEITQPKPIALIDGKFYDGEIAEKHLAKQAKERAKMKAERIKAGKESA